MKSKVVSICDVGLNFLYIDDIKVLQDKFDLLFTTAKLVGYKVNCRYDKFDRSYVVNLRQDTLEDSKAAVIHFNVSRKEEEVYMVAIFSIGRETVICQKNEKVLLDELDKLMKYI